LPAAALTAGLVGATAGVGAITGALAGHIAGGMSRSGLKGIGDARASDVLAFPLKNPFARLTRSMTAPASCRH